MWETLSVLIGHVCILTCRTLLSYDCDKTSDIVAGTMTLCWVSRRHAIFGRLALYWAKHRRQNDWASVRTFSMLDVRAELTVSEILMFWEISSTHNKTSNLCTCNQMQHSGFPRLLESTEIFIGKFPGPGKCWNLLGSDADGKYNDADTDTKIWHKPVLTFAISSLQCFDAVGWVAGRASGL